MILPQDALHASQAPRWLPPVDHYCGTEKLMRKSLALQAELAGRFDVTLDCEDGAAVGGEADHIALVLELLRGANIGRVGVRLHPVDHRAFALEVAALAQAVVLPHFLMLPKLDGAASLARSVAVLDQALGARRPPLQALVETHGALREVEALAAHPAIESLSFGLMDFVSAHQGAIPASAMQVAGQFSHPLVRRAKLAISAACHGFGKTPSHCVVTELGDRERLMQAARRARDEFGFTRMWSIHPAQIEPLLDVFAPSRDEVEEATELLLAAQAVDWAPTRFRGHLHDRASYRHYWSLLQRAHQCGVPLSATALAALWPADGQ